MHLGPLEGAARRASLHDRHPVGEPSHDLMYCHRCKRSFGIDVLASHCCGEMRIASGTLEEMERLVKELERDPVSVEIKELQQEAIRALEES